MIQKHVISIDLDIIMDTCLALYNDLSRTGTREELWAEIKYLRQIEPHLSYNETNYVKLLAYIVKIVMQNPKATIAFTRDHDGILNLLKDDFNDKVKFNIINLDSHHDICYDVRHFKELTDGKAELSNWVGYLYLQGVLQSYTWVHSKASTFHTDLKLEVPYTKTPLETYLTGNTPMEVDYIHFCLSPNWVHPKFDNLFENIRAIVSAIRQQEYVIESQPFISGDNLFCIEREDKPHPVRTV